MDAITFIYRLNEVALEWLLLSGCRRVLAVTGFAELKVKTIEIQAAGVLHPH